MEEATSKGRKSYHVIAFIVLFHLIESILIIFTENLSLSIAIIVSIVSIITLLLFVYLVRSVGNQEKIFEFSYKLSFKQKIMSLILIGYFIFIFIENDNINSVIDIFQSPLKIIISCTMLALGVAIVEEYTMRGYLFNVTQKILNRYNIQKYRLVTTSIITSIFLVYYTFLTFQQENLFQGFYNKYYIQSV